jgi:hypothetical protein
MMRVSQGHLCPIEHALAVHEHHLIASLQAEHAHGVLSFIRRKFCAGGSIGNKEKPYLFHILMFNLSEQNNFNV